MSSVLFSWLATTPFTTILLLKITLLLTMTGSAALVLWYVTPTTRHYVWTAGLGGVLILPLAMVATPAWHVRILPEIVKARENSAALALMNGTHEPNPAPRHERILSYPVAHSTSTDTGIGSHVTAGTYTAWFLGLWLLGTLVSLARIAIGRFGLRRLHRNARLLDTPEWRTDLARECVAADIHRPVSLYVSTAITTPLTWGIRGPVIIVPDQFLSCAREERLMILRHELSHITRYDALTQLITAVTSALYWFHPLVWLAARQQLAESERACDAYVLSYGTSATTYAAQLLQMARAAKKTGHGHVSLAMARRSQLEKRLHVILTTTRYLARGQTRLSPGPRVVGAITLLGTVCAVSAFRPIPRTSTAMSLVPPYQAPPSLLHTELPTCANRPKMIAALDQYHCVDTDYGWILTMDTTHTASVKSAIALAATNFAKYFESHPGRGVVLLLTPDANGAIGNGPKETQALERAGATWIFPWFQGPGGAGILSQALQTEALQHELGHVWFARTFGPTYDGVTGVGRTSTYGTTFSDWLDEAAAILLESPVSTEQRWTDLRLRMSDGKQSGRVQSLDTLITMTHPISDPTSTPTAIQEFMKQAVAEALKQGNTEAGTKGAMSTLKVFQFSTADSNGGDFSKASSAAGFYSQIRGFIDFLLERTHDTTLFLKITQSEAKGAPFATWLKEHGAEYGLPTTVEELDQEWNTWLAKKVATP